MLSEWTVIFRLVLAAVLSGMVGFEREFHGRVAGFRTHILLCIGTTLIMLTSLHIFDLYSSRTAIDPARLAAGVVTGIGFLGAGTIMQYKASVRGLTTAASLWAVTGVGLAVGSGFYLAAIITTALIVVTLMFIGRMEHSMIRKDWYKTIIVETKEGYDQLKGIREVIGEHNAEINGFEVERSKDGAHMVLKIGLKLSTNQHNAQLMHEISRLDGIKAVKWEVV